MPIRRKTVSDGITSEPQIIISAPLDKRDLLKYVQEHNREWERCGTFDGRVAHLERLCRRDFNAWRTSVDGRESIVLDYGSREWYAREILTVMAEVREALARGDWQRAASDAVVVGALAAEAEAKLQWPIVRLGINRKRNLQKSGRERGKQITNAARAEDAKTRRLVDQYRTSDETQGHLVEFLANRLKRNKQTIRRRLKRLGIGRPSRSRIRDSSDATVSASVFSWDT